MGKNTIGAILAAGSQYLIARNFGSSRLDVEIILGHLLGYNRSQLHSRSHLELKPEQEKAFLDLLEKRGAGEPVAYIINKKEFFSRAFYVDSNVLIPRPETEDLVERIIDDCSQSETGSRILDVGTGSGCIAITLSLEIKGVLLDAWDICEGALSVAARNQKALGSKVTFCKKDMCKASDWQGSGKFDYIVSNPPYIANGEGAELETNVRLFEPAQALFGGKEGLDFYKVIARFARSRIELRGKLFLEIASSKAQSVRVILLENGWEDVEIHQDLSGLDRYIVARAPRDDHF